MGLHAQTQIFIEDFETTPVSYTTSIPEFSDGGTDYFIRTDGSNISGAVSLSNTQGSFFFGAQDITRAVASGTQNSFQTLTFDDINIAGFTSLELRIYLAEDDDGSNQDWDEGDFVHINYDIDNSTTFSNLLWIESDISSGFNGEPGIDTDFNGVADGTAITDNFTQFTASITGTGSLLDLVIEFDLGAGDEDIAIDSIEIYGVSAGGNIAPAITNIAISPTTPTDADTVNVTADITDSDGTISTATLNWGTTSGMLTNSIAMSVSSGDNYQTDSAIQAQTNGTTVFYTITATDDDSDSSTSAEQSYTLSNQLPQISNVTRTPSGTVESTDTVSLTADVSDADGTISGVVLNWGTASGMLSNSITMNVTSGSTYQTATDIPAQADGTEVFYTITATDDDSDTTTTTEASYTVQDLPSGSLQQIFIEDFETTPVSYTTSTTEFTDGSGDYFIRTDGSDISGGVTFTGQLGSFFFAAQDIDGEGASANQKLTIDDINISGFTSLELRVYLAEDDDGSAQDWDSTDFVHFGVDIDNTGSFTDVLNVESSGSGNSEPAIDTNFDGTGDGTAITDSFVQFTAIITGTGSLLDLQIDFNLDSGDEDIAIDNIEIWGEPGSPSITYTWDGMAWSPATPEGTSTTSDNIVVNDDYTITSASFSFDNLTVATGATLSANTGTSIIAAGNITSDGTIDINDSNLTLSGGSSQTLSGTGYTIGTLTVNNTNGVTVSASNAIEIINEFALTEGAVTTTDGITLNYDGTNGSADLTYTNGSINGTIIAERYVPVKSTAPVNATYRFLAPQLTSLQTIEEAWQEGGASPIGFGTHITGSTSGANGFDATPSGNPSLLTYEPDTQSATGAGWQFATRTDVNFVTDQAYNLFVRGDRNYNLTDPNAAPGSTTLRISGTPVLGNKVMTASDRGGEFTLIPNPYAASVDVTDVLLNNSTNLETNTFYMFDPNLNTSLNGVTGRGNFVTVTLGSATPSGSAATGIVESGHAFFVQTSADGAASMTFTEAAKSTSGSTTTLGTNNYPTPGFLDITLKEAQFNGIVDGAAINKFNGLDNTTKFNTGYENVFVRYNGIDYVHLNDLSLGNLSTAPIGLRNMAAKDYILVITNLPSGSTLLDTLTGMVYTPSDLASGITFTGMPGMDETTRFIVNSVASIDSVNNLALSLYPNPSSDANVVTISGLANISEVQIQVATLSGQRVFNQILDVQQNRVELPVNQLTSGIYLINVFAGESQQTLKLVIE